MSKGEFGYESPTVPPGAVFVVAGEPLLVFPSAAAAENSLQAIDAAEGSNLAAYGPNGEPYRIRAETNRVRIEREGDSNRPDDLKEHLLCYLEACEDPGDATQPLGELVAIAWSIERDFWLRNAPVGGRGGARVPAWGVVAFVLVAAALWYLAVR